MKINLKVLDESGSSLTFEVKNGEPTNLWAGATAVTVEVEQGIDFEAIIAGVVSHTQQYPDHGSNCACMDEPIRKIRAAIYAQIPADGVPSARLKARWRLAHVLNVVLRSL